MSTLRPPTRHTAQLPNRSPEGTTQANPVESLTRILLVEDEPLTAEVFAQALTRDGHQVEVASDGLQALRRLQNRLPTIVVLDMNLPTVSGSDVVRRIRADGHHQLPVVVVSGCSPNLTELDTAMLSPGIWLEKPVKPRDLVRIVREFTHRS